MHVCMYVCMNIWLVNAICLKKAALPDTQIQLVIS